MAGKTMYACNILMLKATPTRAKDTNTSHPRRFRTALCKTQPANSKKKTSVASMLLVRESATTIGVIVIKKAAIRAVKGPKVGLTIL